MEGSFTWLNHTYTHREMGNTNLAVSTEEIALNTATAANLGFTDYSNQTLLTGDYSGINPPNPNLAQAAYNQGVRYLLVNASVTGFNNPTPNTGIPHPTQPAILQVPRYANNIFYAVTTPEEETDLYNWIYCPGYAANPNTTPRCFDYNFVIDSVTGQALRFMLDYSVDATMFHMNNFNNYGGGRTVMTDFIEALYAKYNALFSANVPVLSLRTQEIGQAMRDRMAYNASGVSGQLACGNQITLHDQPGGDDPADGCELRDQRGDLRRTADLLHCDGRQRHGGDTGNGGQGAGGNFRADGGAIGQRRRAELAGGDAGHGRQRADVRWSTGSMCGPTIPRSRRRRRTWWRKWRARRSRTAAAADPMQNYTYVVTAIGNNCWKLESTPSKRVGRFGFTMAPGL